jgi:hypothetical protein
MLVPYDVRDVLIEWVAGKPIYIGKNPAHKAGTTNGKTWYIKKFTWTGDDCTRIEGPLEGNWADRATLGWA